MPKFEVIVSWKTEQTLSIEVTAKDENTASDRVQKMISDSGYDHSQLAKLAKAEWEMEDEHIEIDDIIEL